MAPTPTLLVLLALCALLPRSHGAAAAAAAHAGDGHVSGDCPAGVAAAYVVYVHDAETLASATQLLTALRGGSVGNFYYVHVDTKWKRSAWASAAEALRASADGSTNGEEIVVASEHSVQWAQWSMVEPTLSGLAAALESAVPWKVFVNLAGDALPVLTADAMAARLAQLAPYNFVTSSGQVTGLRATAWSSFDKGWHKRQAYPYPVAEVDGLEAHYGSQWMVLQRDFAEHVVSELATPGSHAHAMQEWFLHGSVEVKGVGRVKPHIADETFFPTVLMNSEAFRETAPPPTLPGIGLYATHYIRMDEHYPWTQGGQRYATSLEKKHRPWGPYYLGVYDLSEIKASGALFVRKVSLTVDANIFNVLPAASYGAIPDIGFPDVGGQIYLSKPPAQVKKEGAGCVRVAESVHCPPRHDLAPEEQGWKGAAAGG